MPQHQQTPLTEPPATHPRKRGGRPRNASGELRIHRVNARLSDKELAQLSANAAQMNMPPAQWLREAALSRRLPSPPVPAINRQQYAELARLSANLNQLAHAANSGQRVTVSDALLQKVVAEVGLLRLALIHAGGDA